MRQLAARSWLLCSVAQFVLARIPEVRQRPAGAAPPDLECARAFVDAMRTLQVRRLAHHDVVLGSAILHSWIRIGCGWSVRRVTPAAEFQRSAEPAHVVLPAGAGGGGAVDSAPTR